RRGPPAPLVPYTTLFRSEEIASAVRAVAKRVQHGELEPEEITEDTIAQSLGTAGIPDPDLLIRTSGEVRLSNFLLWQVAYTEIRSEEHTSELQSRENLVC